MKLAAGRYVTLPHLIVERRGESVFIGNASAGSGMECSAGVLSALSLLRAPTSLAALAERVGLGVREASEILAPLVQGLFVVPEELVATLAIGPTRAAPRSIGRPISLAEVGAGMGGAIAVVGAPSGVGAGPEGLPSHGPYLVRQAFPPLAQPPESPSGAVELPRMRPPPPSFFQDLDFRRKYPVESMPRVFDVGDVVYEAGEGLEIYGKRLGFVVERLADAGMCPFLIGGDHSLTRYSAGAILRRHERVGILHFDAHHDLYKGLPARPLCHANPFAHLIEERSLAVMRQIGLRVTFEHQDARAEPIIEPRLDYVSALQCQEMSPAEVFAGLPTDIPYYLSFDVDVLDPAYAPETGMPELGGLSFYQCLRLVDYAARHFRVVGMDLVEVGGSDRRINWAARAGARMLAQAMLGRASFEPLRTYLFRRKA